MCYLEQSDVKCNDSTDTLSISSITVSRAASIHVVETVENPSTKQRSPKSRWRYLVDIRSLK